MLIRFERKLRQWIFPLLLAALCAAVLPLGSAAAEGEAAAVSATVSMGGGRLSPDGTRVEFDLCLDRSSFLSTLLLRVSLDEEMLSDTVYTVQGQGDFSYAAVRGDGLIVLSTTGSSQGVSVTERTKIAVLSAALREGVTGEVTAAITKVGASGIVSAEESAVDGEAAIADASATYQIISKDVNGDGRITQVDITEAQRYYQAKRGDDSWSSAERADVNGDGTVDIQDFIAIFQEIDF